MSKYTNALNKIEQKKAAHPIYLVSEKPQNKPSFGLSAKIILLTLVIGALAAGAYFFGKQKTPVQPQPASFFTIQLVTYQTESRAKEQAAKLATEGYESFVLPKGGYFQLCLGKFANQALADGEWRKLKSTLAEYKGMYVRFVHE